MLLALAAGWPPAHLARACPRGRCTSRTRAHALAAALRRARSGSSARAATSPPTSRRAARDRGSRPALLAIEGAHALDDDPANVDVVADAGLPDDVAGHFFDNAFGGSAHGIDKGGLTAAGREMVAADGGARR